jgi:hypothetical protein
MDIEIEGLNIITPKKFKDTRNGEIVERFNILDIKYMEEVKD